MHTKSGPQFGPQVILTEDFRSDWKKLTRQQQTMAIRKIRLLLSNQAHPSLCAHRLKRGGKDVWVCYLSRTNRLIFSRQDQRLILLAIGGHAVVDTVHVRQFSLSNL